MSGLIIDEDFEKLFNDDLPPVELNQCVYCKNRDSCSFDMKYEVWSSDCDFFKK